MTACLATILEGPALSRVLIWNVRLWDGGLDLKEENRVFLW